MNATDLLNDNAATTDDGSPESEEVSAEVRIFVALTPRAHHIAVRSSSTMKPFARVFVGYNDDSPKGEIDGESEMGIFHWTSRTDDGWLRSVALNVLRKARRRGARMTADHLHILECVEISEENLPENVVFQVKGHRHDWMPTPKAPKHSAESLQIQAAEIEARLEDESEGLTDEEREVLTEKLNELRTQIAAMENEASNEASNEVENEVENVVPTEDQIAQAIEVAEEAFIAETTEASSPKALGFRTKKAAMETAGPNDEIYKGSDGRWHIRNEDN